MDVHSKAQRSFNMSQIKSKSTKPERVMFEMLERDGLEFETHYPIAGKPDIVFPYCKVVVFIDGESWHGKNYINTKDSMSPFWSNKIGENIKRDRKNDRILRSECWRVMHIWGKYIIKNPEKALMRIIRFVNVAKSHKTFQ